GGPNLARDGGYNSPVGINRGSDAGIRIAQQPAAILHRAHARLFQMLRVRSAISVPAIVGDIHKDLRPIRRQPPDLIRKYRFIADEDPELAATGLKRGPGTPGGKIANLLGQSSGKAKDPFEGNILAKGNQVYF